MEFIYPETIYLMLIPAIFLIILIATNKSYIDKFFDKEILEKLKLHNSALSKSARNSLLFLALILMIIALSRPVLPKGEVELKSKGYDIVVALDISKSMLAKDFYPNRIDFAKRKVKEFIKLNQNSKIALIAFSNRSFIVSPLTNDSETTTYLLENLNTSSITDGGTSVISALNSANRVLKEQKDKIVVIFTDGGDSSEFQNEINFAKENNLRVYVVSIATIEGAPIEENGGFIKDESGKIVISKINPAIKELAINSNGAFVEATLMSEDMKAIANHIKTSLQKSEFKSKAIKDYVELFYYPLGLAVLILIFAFSSIRKKADL